MRKTFSTLFRSIPFLWGLLVFGLVVIFYAGLSARGFTFRNDVEWLEGGPGLSFGGQGIAYTDPVFFAAAFSKEEGLTLELALRIHQPFERKFQFIVELEAGDERSHLVIGQWEDEIIVLQGEDYGYDQREPRVACRVDPERAALGLTIVSNERGTKLYVDGRERATRSDLVLKIPESAAGARMILGNSSTGLNPWKGEILGLAYHGRALTEPVVRAHFASFESEGNFGGYASEAPQVLWPLMEGEGEISRDHGSLQADLSFPRGKTFVASNHFLSDPDGWRLGWRDGEDVLLNLAGFVPFGFVLAALLRMRRRGVAVLLLTVLVGFLLSLFIETLQAWMPSRTSSLLDLTLNTAGTMVGALCLLGVGRNLEGDLSPSHRWEDDSSRKTE